MVLQDGTVVLQDDMMSSRMRQCPSGQDSVPPGWLCQALLLLGRISQCVSKQLWIIVIF